MTGEKRMFSSYEKNEDPQRAITFGDGNQDLVKGLGKIAISPDHSISNIFLVDSLDYNFCHRRLAHVGMKNLHKLLKGEHILGLINVHFEKDRICSACQAGKQVGTHHPHKNIMMTD
jgi:hypothetical protein